MLININLFLIFVPLENSQKINTNEILIKIKYE
jgi:hypothetical protein